MDVTKFRFGIEHEFPVVKEGNVFADFSNTTFEEFDRVIEKLPRYESDYPGLRVGDLGIKSKRWYVEGFERFDEQGGYQYTDVKGFEIRTPICDSVETAAQTLQDDFQKWKDIASEYGISAARVSLNPFKEEYIPLPPLNSWEMSHRQAPEEVTAYIHMLTSGPDISFSHPDLSTADTIDIAKKLTYYSPYIVPFSFSSPFYRGGLWGGLSRRTYYRTGKRPAVLVFVDTLDKIKSSPTLTDVARISAEKGRIEFKAFDLVEDLGFYKNLAYLLLGIALDTKLSGRALVPDEAAHKLSAKEGFENENIYTECHKILDCAQSALPFEFAGQIDILRNILQTKRSPAHSMIDSFNAGKDIIEIIII